MLELLGGYFIIGIIVYWVRNKIWPQDLLLQVAIWPWYAYNWILRRFVK